MKNDTPNVKFAPGSEPRVVVAGKRRRVDANGRLTERTFTKPALDDEKTKRRKQAKRAKQSRRANRGR